MDMHNNMAISQDAIQFIRREGRMQDPSIVIYRDNPPISCSRCNIGTSTFVIGIKVLYAEKPDESFFMMYNNSYGIPVWVEKRLSSYLENKSILISLKKGLFIRLQIEIGSEVLQSQ
jgi:hypothetical protein